MRNRYSLLLATFVALGALVPACDDGDDQPGAPDAGAPDGATGDLVGRGSYLVNSVLACNDCHTPLLPTGAPDTSRLLAGVDCLLDAVPPKDNGVGCLSSRNLTNHPTGLSTRTDAQIKAMLLDGVRPDGKFLNNVMPYWLLHNLTAADADAVIAYLRTVPGVDRTTPPNESPFDNVPQATRPIQDAELPPAGGAGAVHESAVRGRYLAVVCLDCHTPTTEPGAAFPIDLAKAFQGGRAFPAALLGIPSPPFPEVIFSANLTPHATGLAGYSAADIVKVLKQGKDPHGDGICPPMPVGPMGAFGGLTDADATDIANYILYLAPAENAVPGQCVPPPAP